MIMLIAWVGCTADISVMPDRPPDGDFDIGGTEEDAVLAEELWASTVDYGDWTRPDGWTATPTESDAHVGLFVVRYDNPTLAAWDGTGSAPNGALSLKEEYDAEGVLGSYTAMQKIDGYDPAHSDWFWAKLNVDGTARTAGQVAMCWTCHADAPRDHLHTEPPSGP